MMTPSEPGSSSHISPEQVAHVARLARLDLSETEIDYYTRSLSVIIEHADAMSKLDLAGVPPMSHPFAISNVLRDDVVGECLKAGDVEPGAPDFQSDRFRVPKILEDLS